MQRLVSKTFYRQFTTFSGDKMKIDFHVHTNVSSCSDMSLKNAIKAAIEKGIAGIAICNHNTSFLNKHIPFELESEFNIKINPDSPCDNPFYIIPGIEISLSDGHFLGLFLEEEVEHCDRYVDELKNAGGIVVYAHPFEQEFNYNKRSNTIEYYIGDIDLIETHSGRANYKNKSAVSQAITFANEYKINKCAGSDAHFCHEIGNAWVEFDDSIVGLNAIKEELLNGNTTLFQKDANRTDLAKSQIVKQGYNLKTVIFYLYSYIRDLGDKLCQKSH